MTVTDPITTATEAPIELVIDDVAFGGDGVGRLDGRAVFVPWTLPGERVRARIVSAARRFARAELVDVLMPAPARVAPACPLFGRCGGCAYQHAAYAEQLAIKRKQLADVLQRIGGIDPSVVDAVLPSPRPYGYRNKVTLRVRDGTIGLVAHDGRTLLPIAHCPLAVEAINRRLAEGIRSDRRQGRISVRANVAGKVWVFDADAPRPGAIDDTLAGATFRTPLHGFFQTNPDVAAMLAAWLRRETGAAPGIANVVDAYCGVGVLGLLGAPEDVALVGIERQTAAVRAARRNAERLGRASARFVRGSAETCLDGVLAALPAASTCLWLDPPRAGCADAVLESVRQRRPGLVIYISCNPPALARDIARLRASYAVRRVTGFDMFPQTAAIEAAAVLERRHAAEQPSP